MTKPGQDDAIDESLFGDGAAADDTAIPMDDEIVEDTIPDGNLFGATDTETGLEDLRETPVGPGRIQRIENFVFGLLQRKKKPAVKKEAAVLKEDPVLNEEPASAIQEDPIDAMPSPSLDEFKVPMSDQEHREMMYRTRETMLGNYEPPKKENRFIRIGIFAGALLVFSLGCFSIYSELPTHPTIVIGIILVSLSGAVLVNAK